MSATTSTTVNPSGTPVINITAQPTSSASSSKPASTATTPRRSRPNTPPQAATQEEVAEMKEVFACFDKDSSGSVTTAELGLVLRSMSQHYTDSELKRIVGKFDVNGDGQIDFDEFMAMMTRHDSQKQDELKQAFDVFDKDGDGTISGKELEVVMKALGEHIDRETIDLMIESVDTDANGYIDFEEFRRMMKDGPVEFK